MAMSRLRSSSTLGARHREHGQELRLCHHLAVDDRGPLLSPDRPLALHDLDVELEPVARDDRVPEPRAVDRHEIGELVVDVLPTHLNARSAHACASASRISTPGITGLPGKCPTKNGSFIVTPFQATSRTPGSTATTRSTRRNGGRCGRSALDRLDVEHRAGAACAAGLVRHVPSFLRGVSPRSRSTSLAARGAPCASRRAARTRSRSEPLPVRAAPGAATVSPAGTSPGTPACAAIRAPAPISRCPTTPDLPGRAIDAHPELRRAGDADLRDDQARAGRSRRCGRSGRGCRSWRRGRCASCRASRGRRRCSRRSRRRPRRRRCPPAGPCSGGGPGPRPRGRRRSRTRPSRRRSPAAG